MLTREEIFPEIEMLGCIPLFQYRMLKSVGYEHWILSEAGKVFDDIPGRHMYWVCLRKIHTGFGGRFIGMDTETPLKWDVFCKTWTDQMVDEAVLRMILFT